MFVTIILILFFQRRCVLNLNGSVFFFQFASGVYPLRQQNILLSKVHLNFKFDHFKCLRYIWQLQSEKQQQQQGDIIHYLPQINAVREGGRVLFPLCWGSFTDLSFYARINCPVGVRTNSFKPAHSFSSIFCLYGSTTGFKLLIPVTLLHLFSFLIWAVVECHLELERDCTQNVVLLHCRGR